ncbi:carbon dioxide concentrating mechanism/carboxysome shell protein [Desulfosporosinus acidiphilus SJ4]|uniref:Carbon dioxide concentrating mechanism/carboxysome shell protein n=1 Tax=Desulfosporosinus acidiphilus (strain DSM 22704 / JCM 16185 / SJ4) TaxID=646529 RepID=I4D461_DESAJ|nr:BMC domain-containing protein [Desulfosporosinus acidiphilus]AFM40585.1 carbon dioxide concentrating mechanism/carboxysome shell protein [Desulfosporosinus acidiphilus SJ4]
MQALGLIETRGLLAAIECADVMLKTAQVELVGRTFVGGGLVTIAVTGEVGAVKASVEAGAMAVKTIRDLSLVSQHVIPRPDDDIERLIVSGVNPVNKPWLSSSDDEDRSANSDLKINNEESLPKKETLPQVIETKPKTENGNTSQIKLTNASKEEVAALVRNFGPEKSLEVLKALPMAKLRKLARECKELDLADHVISRANKDLLIQKFKGFFELRKEE